MRTSKCNSSQLTKKSLRWIVIEKQIVGQPWSEVNSELYIVSADGCLLLSVVLPVLIYIYNSIEQCRAVRVLLLASRHLATPFLENVRQRPESQKRCQVGFLKNKKQRNHSTHRTFQTRLCVPPVADSSACLSCRGASTAASATRGSGSRGRASSARTAAAPPPSTWPAPTPPEWPWSPTTGPTWCPSPATDTSRGARQL